MMAVHKHLGTLMLLLSCASSQNPGVIATVESVTAARDGADLRVDITLSSPVTPSVETAFHPDRILLDFPDSTFSDNTKNVPVNANGVRRVRTGQHSATPLVTRVVLDLDQAHTYSLKAEGNHIIVTVGPAENAHNASHGAPVAATSGNLIAVFRRHRDANAPIAEDSSANLPPPIPPATTAGPAFEPPSENSSAAAVPPERPLSPLPHSEPTPAVPGTAAAQPSFEQNQIATAANPVSVTANASSTPSPSPETSTTAIATAKTEEAVTPPLPAAPPAPTAAPPATLIARSDDPSLRTVFKVKYVAEGVAYLEGGRAQGLTEGMKLEIEDSNLPAKQRSEERR